MPTSTTRRNTPKHPAIARRLKEQIVRGAFGRERLPGNQDLAARLNVSNITLRKALNSLVEEGLVETRGTRGTFLTERACRMQPSVKQIALAMWDLHGVEHPHFHRLIRGLNGVVGEADGYALQVFAVPFAEPRHTQEFQRLKAMSQQGIFDGLVVCSLTFDENRELCDAGVPTVVFGKRDACGLSHVLHDPTWLSANVPEEILRRGGAEVCVISGTPGADGPAVRTDLSHSMPEVLTRCGVVTGLDHVAAASSHYYDEREGYDLARGLLERHPNTDCLIVGRHDMAIGARTYLEETGRLDGNFTFIVITAGDDLGDFPHIVNPVETLAREAGRLLVDEIEHGRAEPPVTVALPMAWMKR